jgi:hypothetical protein
MNSDKRDCQSEQIAAYLDGELDDAVRLLFEAHTRECADCGAQVAEQRRLLCQLDLVLSSGSDLPLPINFAQIITARAQSDMSGVRRRREHGLAFRICVILGVASMALLGVAARTMVVNFIRSVVRPASVILDLLWTTVYDVVSGLAIVSRVLSQGLVPNSRLAGALEFVLLALAVLLLSRLIAGYHRTRLVQ